MQGIGGEARERFQCFIYGIQIVFVMLRFLGEKLDEIDDIYILFPADITEEKYVKDTSTKLDLKIVVHSGAEGIFE